MFLPPPPGDNDDHRISDKPLPAAKPRGASEADGGLDPDAPSGEELYNYVFDCFEKGSGKKEVRKQLIAFGYTDEEAQQVVDEVAQWRQENGQRYPDAPNIATSGGDGSTQMLIGGVVCLIGVLITVGSCLAAPGRGGGYTIAWGAIIFGAIWFFRGLAQSKQQ